MRETGPAASLRSALRRAAVRAGLGGPKRIGVRETRNEPFQDYVSDLPKRLSSVAGGDPEAIAAKLVASWDADELASPASTEREALTLRLREAWLAEQVHRQASDPRLGARMPREGRTLLLARWPRREAHPVPERARVLLEALERLERFAGWAVVSPSAEVGASSLGALAAEVGADAAVVLLDAAAPGEAARARAELVRAGVRPARVVRMGAACVSASGTCGSARSWVDRATSAARAQLDAGSPELPADERGVLARVVAEAEIRWALLEVPPARDVVVDPEALVARRRAASVLWAHAACRDLLLRRGAPPAGVAASDLGLPQARRLALSIARVPEVFLGAADKCRPDVVCAALRELGAAVDEARSAAKASDSAERALLELAEGAGAAIALGLDLVGLIAPERM